MPNVTIAFDEAVKGWTSEFTFLPDAGLSLNNNFYTFHRGRIWKHNSQTADRNTFYGVTSDTEITFVFNEHPTIVKNFKNLGFEGSGATFEEEDGVTTDFGWNATIETNLENGIVDVVDFVEKEGKNYGWIRGEQTDFRPDTKSSNVGGLGNPSNLSLTETNVQDNGIVGTLTFDKLPNSLSPRDFIYTVDAETSDPYLVGTVESIVNGVVTWTKRGIQGEVENWNWTPTSDQFFLYAKSDHDKSGIIGYYSIVTMKNNQSDKDIELFSVNTRAFISTK